MPNWNPSSPDTLGLQWPVHSDGGFVIDSDAKAAAVRLPSTVAETLDAVWVYLPFVTRPSRYTMEVFDAGAEVPTDRQVSKFLPTVDKIKENVEAETGSTLDLWRKLAKLDLPEDINTLVNYIRRRPDQNRKQRYIANFSTGTALAGRRVVEVRLVMSGNSKVGQISEALLFDGFNYITLGKGQLRPSEFNRKLNRLVFEIGKINPYTNLSWLVNEVQGFSSSLGAGLDFLAVKEARLHQLYLEVEHVAENRKAVGTTTISEPGWNRFDLSTADRSANWSKPLGTHTYLLRRLTGRGALTWGYLESAESNPFGAVGLYGENRREGTVRNLREELRTVPAISLEGISTGPYVSQDSQNYAEHRVARVFTGREARQRFTAPSSAAYGLVTLLIRTASVTMVAGLTVRVRRVSDNVALGGTATILPTSLADLPEVNGWRRWKIALTSPAELVAGTAYYLQLTSTATGSELGAGRDAWEVGYLTTLGQGSNHSFGSTTEHATVDGVANLDADLPITIATVPLPPPIPPPPPAPNPPTPALTTRVVTFEDRLQAVRLGWVPTSLGTRFGRYEIERSDLRTDWQPIAHIGDELVDFFDDFEGGRGIESSYRIRVMRDDGAVSVWTAPSSATPGVLSGRWLFVSNEFPPISKTYHATEPRSYEMLDNQVLLELYGRDDAVSFRGLEDRGDQFTLNIWVETEKVGRAVFEEVKELIRTQLSYVCVLDPHGWRWFASLSLGPGLEPTDDGFYTIEVTVRTIARTPSTPDPSA